MQCSAKIGATENRLVQVTTEVWTPSWTSFHWNEDLQLFRSRESDCQCSDFGVEHFRNILLII